MEKTVIGLNLEDVGRSNFVGTLPITPEFMGFGGVGAGKRQMLASLALTAARLSPQPDLNNGPSTVQDIADQGEPGGWGLVATPVDSVEPRRFNYETKRNQPQGSETPYIETINYAPEYNEAIIDAVVNEEYAEIDDSMLRHLCCWIKNCNTILIIFDSERFESGHSILDYEDFNLMLDKLNNKNIVPVFTKTDVFMRDFVSTFEERPRSNQHAFQEFVHDQFDSEYDVYRDVLAQSEHDMGYPIYIETETRNGEWLPKIPIQTFGFEQLLDELVGADISTTTSVEKEAKTLEKRLQNGERLFQEAIARYSSGEIEITVARAKFKHAHEEFQNGLELMKDHNQPHLLFPLGIEIDHPTIIDSTKLDKISVLQPDIHNITKDGETTMISDIRSSSWLQIPFYSFTKNKDEIDPIIRKSLILISWWHGSESITFPTKRAINRRVEQARWGHQNATYN
jgi:GTPase SAR1 family protein